MNKVPFVEPSLSEEASLLELTLVSGPTTGVIRRPR
jgi:hypothetical protein